MDASFKRHTICGQAVRAERLPREGERGTDEIKL